MKKIFFILILSSILFAKNALLPEATVAVVNGMALYEDDLQIEINTLLPQTAYHAATKGKKLDDVKDKAMTKLIDSTLLYQYALSIGIKPDKTKMDTTYDKLIEKYKSKDVIEIKLKEVGLSLNMLTKLYNKESVLDQLYENKLKKTITDDELKEYYEKYKYKFKKPEQIRVSLIKVGVDPRDSNGSAKSKEKIEEALKKIQSGSDFNDIATEYSDAMSRVKGGDMGFLHKGRLDIVIEREAYKLKKGEMSDIIDKDIGYFIVKVTDVKETYQLPFDDIKDNLRNELSKKEEDRKTEELIRKLKAKAKIIK